MIDDDEAIFTELAERAGVVARRILSERGVQFLDDLAPDLSREVLRTAWHEAAASRFPDVDVRELYDAIDEMVNSLIMDL